MPNYTKNIVTLTGPQDQLNNLKNKLVKTDDMDIFDFNLLIPMPESLMVECSSTINEYINLYWTSINRDKDKNANIISEYETAVLSYMGKTRTLWSDKVALEIIPDSEYKEMIESKIKSHSRKSNVDENTPVFKSEQDVLEYGKKYLDNLKLYRYLTWYDWSIENWGTKWNSCEGSVSFFDDRLVFTFLTAWSIPDKVYIALYKLIEESCPNVSMSIEFADEDFGGAMGMVKGYDSQREDLSIEYFDEDEEFYEQVWGY